MSERDNRLQEHLEALEAGMPLDRVLSSADNEDTELLQLASALRSVTHPTPARHAAAVIEDAAEHHAVHAGQSGTRPARRRASPPPYGGRERLMNRFVDVILSAALIVVLIVVAVFLSQLANDGDAASIEEATETPAEATPAELVASETQDAVVSAALTLPDGANPGWLETDTAYPPENTAFSPDGSLLATAHKNGTAIIWDLTTGERRHTFQGEVERSGEQGIALTGEIGDLAFSPDGSLLAAARPWVPVVDVWNALTGDLVASLDGQRGVSAVAFSPDGSLLAAGIDSGQHPEPAGKTIIWDTETWSVRSALTDAAPDIAFSPDGSTLVTRSGVSFAAWTGQEIGPVVLWDVETGERRATVPAAGYVMQMALSPDGETLALNTVLEDGAATLLVDVETGETRLSLPAPEPGPDSLAFSPDGSLLVVGYQPNNLVGWDTATGMQIFELTGALGADWLRYPAFNPDGSLLAASSSDGRVLLWNVGALRDGASDVVPSMPPGTAPRATQPGGTPAGITVTEPTGEAAGDQPLDGLPADVEDWDSYELPGTDVTVPVPPGWTVTECAASTDTSSSVNVSIQAQWGNSVACSYQSPEISMTVWPLVVGQTLREWLDAHGRAVPSGTETGSESTVEFYGVENVVETTLGGESALALTHERMGLQVYTVVAQVDGAVIGLSKTHAGQFPLGPVYEMMRLHIQLEAR